MDQVKPLPDSNASIPEDLAQAVVSIVAERLEVPVEELDQTTHLGDDLGADSLDLMDLVVCFRERLGLQIAYRVMKDLDTIGDILLYVVHRLEVTESGASEDAPTEGGANRHSSRRSR